MSKHNQYFIPHLEWEFSDFPIIINHLKFERNSWGVTELASISIWRDTNNKLRGILNGQVSNFQNLSEENFVGEGNIVEGQTVSGLDSGNNIIELKDCLLTNYQTDSSIPTCIKADLSIGKIKIIFPSSKLKKRKTRYDWYACSSIPAHFWGVTFRNLKLANKKIRIGLDEYNKSIENYTGSSSSSDHTVVKIPGLEFIVAKVPDNFVPGLQKGICLEFRENIEKIDASLLNGIREFLSFLFGNEIHYFGNSFIRGKAILEANLHSLSEIRKEGAMPPIQFNFEYDWGDVGNLLNKYLQEYLELRKSYLLDKALSRYWIAKSTPLGVNLPILASAIEILAETYLKRLNNFKPEYLPEEEYLELIKEEMTSLKVKLSSIKGGTIIINKILGEFRKGPNERMNAFFDALGIQINKQEKEAINLRNKMIHGARDYSKKTKIHNDLILTRVYQVLFHKILLTLLKYNGYYIDYSIKGCPSKQITHKKGSNKVLA